MSEAKIEIPQPAPLSAASKVAFDGFVARNTKVDLSSIVAYIGFVHQLIEDVGTYINPKGKVLSLGDQRDTALALYLKCEPSGADNEKIDNVLDTFYASRRKAVVIDMGKKGYGCLPCFTKARIDVEMA